MKSFFLLVDCDNFYVSCERVFNPKLRNRPVGVLSNNDGCIVARSNELKLLDIPMGAPAFKYRRKLENNSVILLSSNYALYGDISSRIVSILRKYTPDIEVYSIDESFLSMEFPDEKMAISVAKRIRQNILRWVGISASIGISNTKTLAKLGSKIAKKKKGIFYIDPDADNKRLFESIPVSDIWGVGRKYKKSLNKMRIFDVWGLICLNDNIIKKYFKITGLRMVEELRGKPCISLEKEPSLNKSIIHSRTFSKPVYSLEELENAIAYHAVCASEKLRSIKGIGSFITVFISTNRFKGDYYSNSYSIGIDEPTDFSDVLVMYAMKALRNIFKKGLLYKKSGVCISGILKEEARQMSLFSKKGGYSKKKRLFKSFDNINHRFGKSTITIGRALRQNSDSADKRSNRFTTVWGELMNVKAD